MSDKQGVPTLPPLAGGGGNSVSNNGGGGQQSVSLQQVLASAQGLNVITTGAGQQFVITSQVPGFPQVITTSTTSAGLQQMGVTRIVNLSNTTPRVVGVASSSGNQLTSPSRQNTGKVVLATSPKLVRTSIGNMFLTPNQTTVTSSPPLKKLKLNDNSEKILIDDTPGYRRRIMEHKIKRMRAIREKYTENASELYFLNAGGNIMDFQQWKKRTSTPSYLHFLRQHRLDPEDDDEDLTLPVTNELSINFGSNTVTQSNEVKISGTGVTPVAVSTTLPAAVAQLSQQGGTPIVPTPIKSSAPVSSPVADKSSTPEIKSLAPPQKLQLPPTPSASQPVVKLVKLQATIPSTCDNNQQSNQEQIVEKAKQEAYVMQRITELQRDGLWSERRLPKVQEPARTKAHWDYLLEEMVWLAADFAQERKWKKAAAKKCARMVQKHFQEKAIQAQKAEKLQELRLKKIAGFVAKEIKTFWANVEKLVEFKAQTRLEEKRKKALDQHLNFIVGQTEKYSTWLTEGLNKTDGAQSVPASINSSRISSPIPIGKNSDDEFEPNQSSEDDEETIAKAEEEIKSNHKEEIELLKKESELPLEDILKELPPNYLEERDKCLIQQDNDNQEGSNTDCDGEFQVDSNESSDDEDTIMEQEKAEASTDHKKELDDLKAENEMSIDELMAKYGNMTTPMEEDSDDEESGKESEKEEDDEAEEKSDSESESEDETKDDESQTQSDDETGVGLKSLLEDFSGDKSSKINADASQSEAHNEMDDVAALAESIQPKGNTLLTTSVVTKIPFLLKHSLREYQHIGLDWLVTMYDRKLNGILADEMGLGKTIQTIALLAHLACEKGNWGPHLIIVPTSVMLNWEMECKKWCPGFKILTYYGTQKERKQKRTGWTKPNAFHICITSYKLVIQDHQSFRRKKWKYLILDEAQNIKNFKSQRWQLLLNFQTQRRLLLTGTPLQNNLMELWSLMHFLMPNVFQSHREFKEWFSNPVTGMIEGNSEYNENIIRRLHKVLRPFLLRRLKSEVEKQLPKKYEHVVMCRLSKRQRFLYDDFMSRAKTKETLASGNLLSVINVLMQLRKVCNHPNLFEVRPTVSPFQMDGIEFVTASLAWSALDYDPFKHIDLSCLNLRLIDLEGTLSAFVAHRVKRLHTPRKLIEEIDTQAPPPPRCPSGKIKINVRLSNQAKAPPIMPQTSKLRNFTGILPTPKVGTSPLIKSLNNQPAPGQGVTLKVASGQQLQGYSVQLVQHQGTVKAIPVPIPHPPSSPATSAPQRITVSNPNLRDGLPRLATQTVTVKQGDSVQRIAVPSFAQLVQTSTGRHLIITSNQQNTTTMSFPMMTSSGQRLTVLSPKLTNLSTVMTSVGGRQVMRMPPLNVTPSSQNQIRCGIVTRTPSKELIKKPPKESPKSEFYLPELETQRLRNRHLKLQTISRINDRRCAACPLYGEDLFMALRLEKPSMKCKWHNGQLQPKKKLPKRRKDYFTFTDALAEAIKSTEQIVEEFKQLFDRFVVYVPAVNAPYPSFHVSHPPPHKLWSGKKLKITLERGLSNKLKLFHPIIRGMSTQFPDPRLIQYDCGKLQNLNSLLRQLKCGSHRVLIFTQMTRMLDVLEAFLNYHGHIYLRLDGATRVDQRQILMERFNNDKRIFCFILSTRSGGVGVNLTGADTVIFYDSDWNPTMDAQAQDRCHRIGQTRDVHIYRLVSEKTIEENILKKANQKRLLGDLAIEGGNFTTAYFKSSTIQDLFNVDQEGDASTRMAEVLEQHKEREKAVREASGAIVEEKTAMGALESALAAVEEDLDVQAAKTAKAEAVADLAEFDENIPLEDGDRDDPQISKAEMEVQNLVSQLTPVERYAMRFVEEAEDAFSAAQLAAAERELEQQKREWELDRLRALREEEERRMRMADDDEKPLTFTREDAQNQVNSQNNTKRIVNKRQKLLPVRRSARRRDSTSSTTSATSQDSTESNDDNDNDNDNDNDDTSDTSSPDYNEIQQKINKINHNNICKKRGRGRPRGSLGRKNRLDLNSPRTRSRGDVKINLWTLDVSPILPSVKRPYKKRRSRIKSSSTSSPTSPNANKSTKNHDNHKENCNDSLPDDELGNFDSTLSDKTVDMNNSVNSEGVSDVSDDNDDGESRKIDDDSKIEVETELKTSNHEVDDAENSQSTLVDEKNSSPENDEEHLEARRSRRSNRRQNNVKKLNCHDSNVEESIVTSSPVPLTRSMRAQLSKPVDLTEDTENLDVNVPTSPSSQNDVDGHADDYCKVNNDQDVEENHLEKADVDEDEGKEEEEDDKYESSTSTSVDSKLKQGVLTRRSRTTEAGATDEKKQRRSGNKSTSDIIEMMESDISMIKTLVGTSKANLRVTRSSANAKVLDNGFLLPAKRQRSPLKLNETKKICENTTFLARQKRPDTPMPEDKSKLAATREIQINSDFRQQRAKLSRKSIGDTRDTSDTDSNGNAVNSDIELTEKPQRTAKVVAILSLDAHARFNYGKGKKLQDEKKQKEEDYELGHGLMDDEDDNDTHEIVEEIERKSRKNVRRRDRELSRYPGIKNSEVQLVDIMDDEDLQLGPKKSTRHQPTSSDKFNSL